MNLYWAVHASAQKITQITKLLKVCYIFNTNRIRFKIARRRTEMMHQQRVNRSRSHVVERAVGEWRLRLLLVFILEKNILRTCCNTDDVM